MKTRSREMVPVRREVAGQPAEVRTVLATANAQGRLLAAPEMLGQLVDGRIVVEAYLLEPAGRAKASGRRWNAPVVAAYVVAAVGIVGALVAAAVAFLAWVAAHLAMIVGVTVVVLFLLGKLVASGKCPGLHCPGCDG